MVLLGLLAAEALGAPVEPVLRGWVKAVATASPSPPGGAPAHPR
jgi:hypothetical protein